MRNAAIQREEAGVALLAIALSGGAALCAYFGWIVTAVVLLLCSCGVALIYSARAFAGYTSLTAVFVLFFMIYALAAPAALIVGFPILSGTFSAPYETARVLMYTAFAFGGLVCGLLAGRIALGARNTRRSAMYELSLNADVLFVTAIVLVALASAFELINFLRAGGFDAVRDGKTVYQGLVDALRLTLPSYQLSNIAVAAFSLFVAHQLSGRRGVRSLLIRVAAFALALSPLIFFALLVTRRTEIIAWVLIVFVGLTWTRPLKRITTTLILVALGAYLLSPVIYATRSYAERLEFGIVGTEIFWSRIAVEMNPARGEFGVPFGVFSEYLKNADPQPKRFGTTYLNGVASAVPGFLWPGTKPAQVDYEIRDKLFPRYGQRSSIESPGFSAVLEAYINFGSTGVFLVYVVLGSVLAAFERLRLNARSLLFGMVYLTLMPIAQSFHRSAFGPAVISFEAMTVALLVLFALVYLVVGRLVPTRLDASVS